MRKYIDPFLYRVPIIDVHGFDRAGAVAVVKNFIDNYFKINEKKLLIVHGKGEGILRNAIREYLKHDKRVLDYNYNNFNDGETIVTLK